jgi:hypothetical protein
MTEVRPRQGRDLVLRDVGDELMFYEREGDRVHILNGTARTIFRLCDGQRSIDEIAAELVQEFEVQQDTARRDVEETVDRLCELGILRRD